MPSEESGQEGTSGDQSTPTDASELGPEESSETSKTIEEGTQTDPVQDDQE